MNILQIPVKFQKGDTVYAIKQEKIQTPCTICEGVGTINYKEKDLRCPECMGKGHFRSNKHTNIVIDEPFVINSIKISIYSNGERSVKYKGRCGLTSFSRNEVSLFKTKEEAKIRCDELNREKINLKIEDIIIQDSFKETHPSTSKIQSKLNHYVNKNKFESPIIVNKENELIDGYISYLLCKLLNKKSVEVVVGN